MLSKLAGLVPQVRLDSASYELGEFDKVSLDKKILFAQRTFERASGWASIIEYNDKQAAQQQRLADDAKRALEEAENRRRAELSNDLSLFSIGINNETSESVLKFTLSQLEEEKFNTRDGILSQHLSDKIIAVQNRLIEIESSSKKLSRWIGVGGLVVGVLGTALGLIALL
jgi:hypothetical protein